MRIAVLTTVFPRWEDDFFGSYIYHQAISHTDSGAEVRVVAPHAPGASTREELGGVRVERFRYGLPESTQKIAYGGGVLAQLQGGWLAKLLLPVFVVSFFVRSIGTVRWSEVVHAHWTLAGLIGLSLARLFRKRSVLTVYGIEVFTGRFRMLTKLCLRWADYVICISTATENKMREQFGAGVAKESAVIPFGVPEEYFAERDDGFDIREHHGQPRDAILVLSVGRLIARKGLAYLLRAIPRLRQREELRFVIAGDGPERPTLERLAAELGVHDLVTFAGAVTNDRLPSYYSQCDVFAHPVITDASGDVEGLGLVVLEAMAKAKPAIASGIGGLTDVVADGETGFLVPEKDVDAIVASIDRLAAEPELRDRMGRAAKWRAAERFSASNRAAEVMSVYQQLLERGAA